MAGLWPHRWRSRSGDDRLFTEEQSPAVVFQEFIDPPGEILEGRAMGGEDELGRQVANSLQ
jgi:hypothetical protein